MAKVIVRQGNTPHTTSPIMRDYGRPIVARGNLIIDILSALLVIALVAAVGVVL